MYNIYYEEKSGILLVAPSFDGESHIYTLDGPATIRISDEGALEIVGEVSRGHKEKCNEWYRYHHYAAPVEGSPKEEWNNGPVMVGGVLEYKDR